MAGPTVIDLVSRYLLTGYRPGVANMIDAFPAALALVLTFEGGYANNPADPGGETNKGITHATYDAWRRKQGLPVRSVKLITSDEVSAIYRAEYWDKVRADALPYGLDVVVFDLAVNSGPAAAARMLQKALGFTGKAVDGVVGPATLAAATAADRLTLIRALLARREAFYRALAARKPETGKVYLRVWLRRLADLSRFVGVSA